MHLMLARCTGLLRRLRDVGNVLRISVTRENDASTSGEHLSSREVIPHYDADMLREFSVDQRREYWREIACETREWLPKSCRRYFVKWLSHPDRGSLLKLYKEGSEARQAVVQLFLTEYGLISSRVGRAPD